MAELAAVTADERAKAELRKANRFTALWEVPEEVEWEVTVTPEESSSPVSETEQPPEAAQPPEDRSLSDVPPETDGLLKGEAGAGEATPGSHTQDASPDPSSTEASGPSPELAEPRSPPADAVTDDQRSATTAEADRS
jgi:hypothetical protein